MKHKFKIGDRVIYEELIGIVGGLTEAAISGEPMLNLVSEENAELSCTAMEAECEIYDGQELDQTAALNKAHLGSLHIQNTVGRLTDKYFRDGNH